MRSEAGKQSSKRRAEAHLHDLLCAEVPEADALVVAAADQVQTCAVHAQAAWNGRTQLMTNEAIGPGDDVAVRLEDADARRLLDVPVADVAVDVRRQRQAQRRVARHFGDPLALQRVFGIAQRSARSGLARHKRAPQVRRLRSRSCRQRCAAPCPSQRRPDRSESSIRHEGNSCLSRRT